MFVPSSTGGSLTAFSTRGALPLARVDRLVRLLVPGGRGRARLLRLLQRRLLRALGAQRPRRSGRTATGGPISGAAVVVDGVAYAGSFAHRILGVDARSGRVVLDFPHGEYVPVSGGGDAAAAARLLAPLRGRAAMKRVLLVGGASLVVLAAVGAGVAYVPARQARVARRPRLVDRRVRDDRRPRRRPPPEPGIAWPMYGHDPARLRFGERHLARAAVPSASGRSARRASSSFRRRSATAGSSSPTTPACMFAIGAANGKRAWKLDVAPLRRVVAGARPPRRLPGVPEHAAVQPHAERRRSPARSSRTPSAPGASLWRRHDRPVRVVAARRRAASVYVGDWNGRVWALRRRTGKTRWVTKLGGQVKGGVADLGRPPLRRRLLGPPLRARRRSGSVLWKAKVQPRFGNTGTFYATPSVAYGRVYVGATDGKVYSFGAASGKLRWSQSTGGYVYSSTAVWRDRVYAGSYSKRFYCFDAATGQRPLAVHGERARSPARRR